MTQLELFSAPPKRAATPGELNRISAQRLAWRIRQRRCRANRAWRAQVLGAPLEQNARLGSREAARGVLHAGWSQEQFRNWVESHNGVLGALMHGGPVARRALELVRPREMFDERFAVIWEAMATLHGRGALINDRTVSAQLKRTGVMALLNLEWLGNGTMPRPDVAQVEVYAAFLSAAAQAEPKTALAAAA